MSTRNERSWGDLSPQEQISRLEAKTTEAEAAGMHGQARAFKSQRLAILAAHTDAQGRIRLPSGSGEVTKSRDEIEQDDRQRVASEDREDDSDRSDHGEDRQSGPGARRAAREGVHRIKYPEYRRGGSLDSGPHHLRYEEAKRRLGY